MRCSRSRRCGCSTAARRCRATEFVREREVVRNEIRQRGRHRRGPDPAAACEASIYPKGHAYARPIGGDDRQLSTIGRSTTPASFMARLLRARARDLDHRRRRSTSTRVAAMREVVRPDRQAQRGAAHRGQTVHRRARQGRVSTLDVERPSVHVDRWALPAAQHAGGRGGAVRAFATVFGASPRKAEEYDFAYAVEPQLLGGELAPAFAISIALKDIDKLDEALAFVEKAARRPTAASTRAAATQIEESQNRRKAAFIAGLERLPARTNDGRRSGAALRRRL